MDQAMNLYAADGLCHNAEAGTYGHECGKAAVWLGETRGGFRMGFCDDCRQHGLEARDVVEWVPHPRLAAAVRP
jgi:hypothetical protein